MAKPKLPTSSKDQPAELQQVSKLVRERKELAEKLHAHYRDRWDQYYGLYRNYRRLRSTLKGARERDRDEVLRDAQREWGAELFVPYCFTVIETIVPRVISQDPRMIVLPRTSEAKPAAQRVQELLDVQQKEISYDLKLQTVARSGLKYGLGVQKTFWQRDTRQVLRATPEGEPVLTEAVLREGPQVEPVSIWDFFWEPSATSIETAGWVIHRTWRSQEYVKRKVESGEWFPIDLGRVQGQASDTAFGELHQKRLEAAGILAADPHRGKMHEVWEYHDRENVYTILNRDLVVQAEQTPFFHRELPFQIYRPTPQEHEFVGIGEIEPIAHLQYELNTLRSQRRDNATLVLQKPFIYSENFVDPDHLKIGPGKGIPVRAANIRDVIEPVQFPDIPASGYREEDSIKEDIERTTGVSDAVAGGAGAGTTGTDTATGIQLIQAAANVRIRLKTKNLEREVVRPAARQFVELNRQYVLKPRQIRVPDTTAEQGFRFEQVGPPELNAEIDDPVPDAGSTEPDNPPQRQSTALNLYQALAADPAVDKAKLSAHVLREFDVPDAESFLVPPDTVQVNPQLLGHSLAAMGVPEDVVLEALEMTLEASGNMGESSVQNEASTPE